MRTHPTTLLQIVCEFMHTSKVIWRNVTGPEDICHGNLLALNGNIRLNPLHSALINICNPTSNLLRKIAGTISMVT